MRNYAVISGREFKYRPGQKSANQAFVGIGAAEVKAAMEKISAAVTY